SHYKIDPDLILLDSNDNTKSKVKDGYWKHDKVGEEILVLDDDIRTIIEDCESDFNPVDISSIFLGNEKQFRGVVSSDLDADRIDYLLRTSLHTGLPYGAVDIDYLIGHMSLDKNQYICLDPRALRTAEHYLIARYFDYLQVSYHKSVMGFELLLERVISELLKSNLLKYSSEDIKKMMGDEWYTFDDSFLLREIKKKIGKLENKQVELMFRAIIERKPPKLIQKFDVVGKRFEFPRKKDEYPLRVEEDKLRLIIHDLAKEFKINKELWFIGSKEDHPVTFSNAYPIPDDEYKKDDDYTSALSKVVHIKSKNDDSKPIFESSESLLQLLSKHATFPLRLYVLFPEDMISQRNELAKDISQRVDSYISD
ncbi:hypothetical protein KAU08_07345, partial [bacterium]|nr:hypothetical protein [bacterium]